MDERTLQMTDAEYRMFSELLERSYGLHFGPDSRFVLEKRIARRLRELEISSFAAYHYLLRSDSKGHDELSHLVDDVTTNETYFFRERNQLRALVEEILPELRLRRAASRGGPTGIWSAGCSSGEEPYSVVMLAREAGFVPGRDLRVYASDISRRMLRRARQGVYREASFRETEDHLRRKYFSEKDGLTRIADDVKQQVTFAHLNLLDRSKIGLLGPMDVILCRNVIIYFGAETKRRVIQTFYEKLRPGGHLLLGHSESLIHLSTRFQLRHLRRDLVYCRPLAEVPAIDPWQAAVSEVLADDDAAGRAMNVRARIRVLVIDDSAFSRQAITRMLDGSPLVEVVGVARDGEEALRKAFDLEPDLITLDLEMPRMDGFTFLRIIMARRPTPVMVISGRAGEEDVFKALELGAVDFLAKPTPRAAPELVTIEQELIRKVHSIRELRIEKVRERLAAIPPLVRPAARAAAPRVVAIGSSTGGPAALMQIFGAFAEPPSCAFLVAQHMPAGFTASFAERIDRLTPLEAREARGGEEPRPGSVLVAPGGRHLELEQIGGRVVTKLAARRAGEKYAPSVDRLFQSAAKHYGKDLLSVVLTGMGDDGRRGVGAVNAAGGSVIAESEETAVIFGMPQQAIRSGAVHRVLPLGDIALAIQTGVRRRDGEGSSQAEADGDGVRFGEIGGSHE